MTETFKLKKGEIFFEEDKIIILDNARKQRRLTLLTSSLWTFYGTMSVLRYLKTGDPFLLWTGLLIGIGHLLIIVISLLRTTKSEISLNEVKSIKVKQCFRNKYLHIKLKTNRLRRIIWIDNSEELLKYIEIYFNSKRE
jgi:hypothetical protein